jgi:HD-GYP domain-containing protein (c-di-GMP phosphodiesterase class II)
VELFCDEAPKLFRDLDGASWDEVIAAEPALEVTVSDEEFEDALEAIGEFAELKSPWTMGHSRGVADLAAEAARAHGLPAGDATLLRRAGLVHDIGRLGVSNAIWDKRGALTQAELERVRLHFYLSERNARVLARARPARRDRSAASRADRRVGLSARPVG